MAARARPPTFPETYFDWVRRFPLVSIRDEAHLDEATRVLDQVLRLDPEADEGVRLYLDTLTDLVAAYEARHHPIPNAPEADVLRELMRANGLTQQKLAAAVGIAQSTLSAVLGGSRSLTRAQVVALARHFHVAPGAFSAAPVRRVAKASKQAAATRRKPAAKPRPQFKE